MALLIAFDIRTWEGEFSPEELELIGINREYVEANGYTEGNIKHAAITILMDAILRR